VRKVLFFSEQGYLPGQLYNLNTHYGGPEELKALLDDLKAAGLSPVADIVINHRCADAQDENGVWNNYRWGGAGCESRLYLAMLF
jgi:alpha-amylase